LISPLSPTFALQNCTNNVRLSMKCESLLTIKPHKAKALPLGTKAPTYFSVDMDTAPLTFFTRTLEAPFTCDKTIDLKRGSQFLHTIKYLEGRNRGYIHLESYLFCFIKKPSNLGNCNLYCSF
jgi:hypothetical protein